MMKFDFSALHFETIDANVNTYPDMYLNSTGVTFTKKGVGRTGIPGACALHAGCGREGVCDSDVQEQ